MTENTLVWVVGLSNGETLTENRRTMTADENESSWTKLQNHLKNNNLTITSFSIRNRDRQFHLPNNLAKFGGRIPNIYNCFRYMENVLGDGVVAHYMVAEAIYDDYKVQMWVNMLDDTKCFINVI